MKGNKQRETSGNGRNEESKRQKTGTIERNPIKLPYKG